MISEVVVVFSWVSYVSQVYYLFFEDGQLKSELIRYGLNWIT